MFADTLAPKGAKYVAVIAEPRRERQADTDSSMRPVDLGSSMASAPARRPAIAMNSNPREAWVGEHQHGQEYRPERAAHMYYSIGEREYGAPGLGREVLRRRCRRPAGTCRAQPKL